MVPPATFTSTRARRVAAASQGSSCSRTASRPASARPTAFHIPPANSATRGAGCPRRASGVTALVTIPPRASRSITPDTSCPKPAVPEARRTGFWKETPNSRIGGSRSEEHTSELQSRVDLVCRLLLEKKKKKKKVRKKINRNEQKDGRYSRRP